MRRCCLSVVVGCDLVAVVVVLASLLFGCCCRWRRCCCLLLFGFFVCVVVCGGLNVDVVIVFVGVVCVWLLMVVVCGW